MSRIGRLPIAVPVGVEVKLDGRNVDVTGPKGALSMTIAEPLEIAKNDEGQLQVTRPNDERESRSLLPSSTPSTMSPMRRIFAVALFAESMAPRASSATSAAGWFSESICRPRVNTASSLRAVAASATICTYWAVSARCGVAWRQSNR